MSAADTGEATMAANAAVAKTFKAEIFMGSPLPKPILDHRISPNVRKGSVAV
jgi:hypothetical protein